MPDSKITIEDVTLPCFLYGTAWKEDETSKLVEAALEQGFRGIDTANQRKHYHEAAVGRAISAAIENKLVKRSDMFLQTKFTFQRGQDHRLPYDPLAPVADQVSQSFEKSLVHLNVDSIDSYVLHGPSQARGIGPDDWEAWKAMEQIQRDGRTRFLGVSNVSLDQLMAIFSKASVKPSFVQNRCYASQIWDRQVRQFCQNNGIVYQGFSLLTANRRELGSKTVRGHCTALSANASASCFSFCFGRRHAAPDRNIRCAPHAGRLERDSVFA